jgi:hypothetical protein
MVSVHAGIRSDLRWRRPESGWRNPEFVGRSAMGFRGLWIYREEFWVRSTACLKTRRRAPESEVRPSHSSRKDLPMPGGWHPRKKRYATPQEEVVFAGWVANIYGALELIEEGGYVEGKPYYSLTRVPFLLDQGLRICSQTKAWAIKRYPFKGWSPWPRS